MSCISEATKKTGKYVRSALTELERRLGVHAVILVAYQDDEGEVKISECVSLSMIWLDLTIFEALKQSGYLQRHNSQPHTAMR